MSKLIRALLAIKAAINSCSTKNGQYRIEEMTVHYNGYCEPGYDGDIIVTGDWNVISQYDEFTRKSIDLDKTPARLCNVLEKIGVEIEWDDEWANCSECCGLLRTRPDSYSWTPSYVNTDDGIVCDDCLDGEAHLSSIESDCSAANTISSIDPDDYGYTRINEDFASGFHSGQDADPKLIGGALEDQGIYRYIFQIDSRGQFDTKFSVWVHSSEMDRFDERHFNNAHTDGPSNAARLRSGLKEASKQMDKLKGDGIKHANITPDGVKVKLVSHKDFIEGNM